MEKLILTKNHPMGRGTHVRLDDALMREVVEDEDPKKQRGDTSCPKEG